MFLLAFPALFSIVNPIGTAFIFLSATGHYPHALRANMARWIAIYGFLIVTGSVYVGAYVLGLFGCSASAFRSSGMAQRSYLGACRADVARGIVPSCIAACHANVAMKMADCCSASSLVRSG